MTSARPTLSRHLRNLFLGGLVVVVGDVVVLPVTDVTETDLSVEDGVSLMLSAGASVPRVVVER